MSLRFLEFYVRGVLYYILFLAWLLSPGVRIVAFTPDAEWLPRLSRSAAGRAVVPGAMGLSVHLWWPHTRFLQRVPFLVLPGWGWSQAGAWGLGVSTGSSKGLPGPRAQPVSRSGRCVLQALKNWKSVERSEKAHCCECCSR